MKRVKSSKQLNEFTTKRVCGHLRNGMPRNGACILSEITEYQFRTWFKKGEAEPDGEYGDFYHSVMMAEMQFQAKLVARAVKGSRHNPALAMQILKTRFSEDWSERQKVQVDATVINTFDTRAAQEFTDRLASLLAAASAPWNSAGEIEGEVVDGGDGSTPQLLAPVGE